EAEKEKEKENKIRENKEVDHIINSAAKSNHMFVGQISVPIALRGLKGVVAGVGAHHSQVLVESVTQ
ncbi:hypothetical protein C5167_027736, partial [Papaver somniferum]